MKKFITITLFFLAAFTQTHACDVCGCGVGNFNPHMFPHLSKNFVSVSYQYRYFRSNMEHEGAILTNKEFYHSVLLTTQYSPVKNLQLMAMLPYQLNRQSGVHGDKSLNKPGDIVLLGNYRLLDKYTGKSAMRQTLLLGGGVKLPTGKFKYDHDNEGQVHNANFQAGTGSTDFLLNGSYNLRIRKCMLTAGMTYKMNSSNKEDYRFGDRFLAVSQFKYIQDAGKLTFIPNAGFSYESMKMDRSAGLKVEHTGGRNLQLVSGLDINNKTWAVGFNWIKPVSQHLGEGHIDAMPGWNIHLSYSF